MRIAVDRSVSVASSQSAGWRLKPAEWEALPLPIRLQTRLSEILMLLAELQAEFYTEEANAWLWVEGTVTQLFIDVEKTLQRLAN